MTHPRLLAVVGVLLLLTTVGLIVLWPDAGALPEPERAPEQLVDGIVRDIESRDTEPDPFTGSSTLLTLRVELTSGPEAGEVVAIETMPEGYPPFEPGDEVKLSRSSLGEGETGYFIVDFERRPALIWLLAIFVAVVLLVGGWQGLRSLLGVGVSLAVVVAFVVPGILAGSSPALIALVGGMAVVLVNLYLAHGVDEKTTVAVIGTAAALVVTVALGVIFLDAGAITGFSSEEATLAQFRVEGLDLQGLVLAGLIIGTLGVLDDVTVTQASTVFTLRRTAPDLGGRELFTRAMGVGRDHIASTVNTLVLAYAGASLALLVMFSLSGQGAGEILNSEILAEEIIRTLVGSIGLVLAVPATTGLAAAVAVARPAAPPRRPREVARAADPEVDDSELDEEERAERAWLRFLAEGGAVPDGDDDGSAGGDPGARADEDG